MLFEEKVSKRIILSNLNADRNSAVALISNCNIHAEQKILVMDETRRYKIWSKLKV
jgi:hypothetical protein